MGVLPVAVRLHPRTPQQHDGGVRQHGGARAHAVHACPVGRLCVKDDEQLLRFLAEVDVHKRGSVPA